MPTYKLNVIFDSQCVKTVYDAGEKVVLLKKASAGTPIAWVTFNPFEQNYITWNENYAIYSSNVEVKSGATIKKLSEVSAVPKQLYEFDKGTFGSPASLPDGQEGQYAVLNKMNGYSTLVFGLAQEVECNGVLIPGSPINAATVPLNHTAKFTPYEVVTVFLEGEASNGTVITDVVSKSLDVTFGGDVTEITIQYDPGIGGFKKL